MGSPIVFAEDAPEVLSAEMLPEGGMSYKTRTYGTLISDLGGIYQQKNMNTILHVLQALSERGFLSQSGSGMDFEKSLYELNTALKNVCAFTI